MGGIPLIVDDNISTETEWIFPKHRFFEYEPKDEQSCRALGIGYERLKPKAFFINPDQCGVRLLCNKSFEIELREWIKREQKKDSTGRYGRVYCGLEYSCGEDA